MSRARRIELLEAIQEKRRSRVITYITSDRPNLPAQIAGDVVPLLHQHLQALCEEDCEAFDLILYSRGGRANVPWTIVSMFREYCGDRSFNVLIPYKAHSAATVIAIGADHIFMTRKAELGPIDTTISSGPYNPTEKDSTDRLPISVEDVTGYFALLEQVGCHTWDDKSKAFELLTDAVHPLALGDVKRTLEQTKLVSSRLLNTRKTPFPRDTIDQIVKRLSSEVYSHEHTIGRSEAREYVGLSHVQDAEDTEIADELWSLYEEYESLFELKVSFAPEEYLIANDEEEHTWENLKLACVESIWRFDCFKQNMKVTRIPQVPPTVQINLGQIVFPPLTIPGIPSGVTPDQINDILSQLVNATVQSCLNETVQNATRQLLKSLPTAGFQKTVFSGGWAEGDE